MGYYSKQEIRNGLKWSIGILFLLSLAGSLVIKLLVGDEVGYFPGAEGRWVGELVGQTLVPFFVALIIFFVMRLARADDAPMAGLVAGIFTALIICIFTYVGSIPHPAGG